MDRKTSYSITGWKWCETTPFLGCYFTPVTYSFLAIYRYPIDIHLLVCKGPPTVGIMLTQKSPLFSPNFLVQRMPDLSILATFSSPVVVRCVTVQVCRIESSDGVFWWMVCTGPRWMNMVTWCQEILDLVFDMMILAYSNCSIIDVILIYAYYTVDDVHISLCLFYTSSNLRRTS